MEVSELPVAQRMRAAYWLKHVYENAAESSSLRSTARRALELAMLHRSHGSLLRHEAAYVLGQLRDAEARESLETILGDGAEDAMLRHECAEALGGIGVGEEILSRLAQPSASATTPWEVRQTCEIARDFLKWKLVGDGDAPVMACACMLSPFNSHDPAPPDPEHASWQTEALSTLLRAADRPIFDRYRAMFSLRNRGGEACVKALGRGLVEDESSPLLRHEIAFVLGQMQHSAALPFLAESLRRKGEHSIVRHESAEAIGALEDCWDACEKILTEFKADDDIVIRQSCEVALDAADYFGRTNDDKQDQTPVDVSFTEIKNSHFNLAGPVSS